MKKILLVLFVLPLAFCTGKVEKEDIVAEHVCTVPEEIGDTLVTGETIDWDCDWEASYKSGNVAVIRDDNGGVIIVARNVHH